MRSNIALGFPQSFLFGRLCLPTAALRELAG